MDSVPGGFGRADPRLERESSERGQRFELKRSASPSGVVSSLGALDGSRTDQTPRPCSRVAVVLAGLHPVHERREVAVRLLEDALAAGGQAIVPSQLVSHCGSRGALYTHYRLGGLGARQVRAMQGWVRQRHNRSCAPYALSPNQDLVRLRSMWPRTPSPPTDMGATCAA